MSGTQPDGCSTAASGAHSNDCTSATLSADYHVLIEDPPVAHRELATLGHFAVAAPNPVAVPIFASVPRIDFVAPFANVFSLAPQLKVFAAPAVRPFLPAPVVLHVM